MVCQQFDQIINSFQDNNNHAWREGREIEINQHIKFEEENFNLKE